MRIKAVFIDVNMSTRTIHFVARIVALATMTAVTAIAQTEYKQFTRGSSLEPLLTLSGDKNGNLTFTSPRLANPVRIQVPLVDSLHADTMLALSGDVVFFEDRIQIGATIFLFTDILDVQVEYSHDTTVVKFLTSTDSSRAIVRLRQGSIIRAFGKVLIDSQQFVRGNVFTVVGDIVVRGEVNKDVVSVFGTVSTASSGVVRGATATMFGGLEVSKNATVYGSMLSPRHKRLRRFQILSRDREFTIDPDIRYNRVDGLTLFLGFAFHDHDSLLPSLWASGGYAFESERWRYKFGLEQTIARSHGLVLGGEAYRLLSSGDDWLLGDYENLANTIIAREDFKDYYEAEGGRVYGRIRPMKHLSLGVDFRSEATHWLDAHPRLWAIFGGHKRFRDNYSTVNTPFRTTGIVEIESTTVAGLNFSATFDTRSTQDTYKSSGWFAQGNLEWSDAGFGSDFDYSRYAVSLTRYQKIHHESMLLLRAMYGGSDGYLPMHKRIYLGGLGTWQGYGHKEFMGSRFWMTNAEYRVIIPGSDIALSAFWDCGQIANDAPLNAEIDTKHTIGMAGYLGSSFRISVAKRLDRSEDDAPKIYARLTRHF